MNEGSYVLIKRCVNCGCNNGPSDVRCKTCSYLFIKSMDYNEWVNYCTDLQKKAKAKEDKSCIKQLIMFNKVLKWEK